MLPVDIGSVKSGKLEDRILNTTDILIQLRNLGIRLDTVDGDLRLRGATDRLTPALTDAVRAAKPALLALLGGRDAVSTPIAALTPQQRIDAQPLSYSQQRLWFLEQLMPDSALYNVPYALRLVGALDVAALGRAIAEIVRRHEILRTRFTEADGVPTQQVLPAAAIEPAVFDLRDHPLDEREARARALADAEAATPFDLSGGGLLRVSLIVLGASEHIVLLTLHHIVSDGWSIGLLVREFSALYDAFAAGRPSPLAELRLQYADFARWQRDQMDGARLQQQLTYWQKTLDGVPSLLALPLDRPRVAGGRHMADTVEFSVPTDVVTALHDLARHERATLFMTLSAAWALLLSRCTGQDDLCTGTPVAGRDRPELEDVIGFFVNTLPLRTRVDEHASFAELVRQTRTTVLDAFANSDAPFEQIVDALGHARDATHAPLVQAMFVFQNLKPSTLDIAGLDMLPLPVGERPARFDLTLVATQSRDRQLECSFEYDTDLYERESIELLVRRFGYLLRALAHAPQAPLTTVPWLDPDEVLRIFAHSTGAAPVDGASMSIRRIFERQAAATPQQTAIVHNGAPVSFDTLNRMANGVASRLQNAGTVPGAIVALFSGRSVEMIAGMLGIWKAGAAYLPLDPNLPRERIVYMIGDARPAFVLAQPHLIERVPAGSAIVPLTPDAGAAAEAMPNPVAVPHELDQLAYLIYTSGSSGRPKGVAVTGRNLLAATEARLSTVAHYRALLLILSLSFDGTLAGLLGTLLRGGTLVIPNEAQLPDPAELAKLIERHGVDTLFSTPSLYTSLVREATPHALAGLRQIIVAGEAWPASIVAMTRERCPNAVLFNEYGPSEATIWASVYEVKGDLAGAPPIGGPIAGWQLYVVDRHDRLLPPGVVGELYIGGAGITRGYLNRPDLTAERFIPDPFGSPGGRLYRTGDIVRRRSDGALMYLGRNDEQVKVRGFRIELGEVEAGLKDIAGVREAAVLTSGEGESKQLVAYVVAPGLHAATLRATLRGHLPDYLVPSRFVLLERFPVTSNGKLDRHRLVAMGEHVERPARVAPTDALERTLTAIWAAVLGVGEVGIDDDFFDLGGHSLLATQLISRVRHAWGDVPLRTLFEAPAVRAFAARLREQEASGEPVRTEGSAVPALGKAPEGAQPLSFAQQRLWFLNQFEPDSAFYNMPAALRMRGVLNLAVLERCLAEIVRRHAVLRTGFPMRDGVPVQVIGPAGQPILKLFDLRGLPADEAEQRMRQHAKNEADAPFDLAQGPLLRATLVRIGETDAVLLFTVHHIAADGWSFGLLVREMTALYSAFAAGLPSPLPELTRQYADFSHWQRTWLSGAVLDRQLGYWAKQLDDAPPLLMLPIDKPRPAVQRHLGDTFAFVLPAAAVSRLRELTAASGATLFMGLAAAFSAFLSRVTGQHDLCFGTPIANRNHAETEDLIGFFVNTLVVRARLEGNPDFIGLLQQIRATTLDAYANQDLPFELLVERLSPERQTSHTPLFQTLLALQNMPAGQLDMHGLALEAVDLPSTTSKFDLSLYLMEQGGTLHGTFEFNTDLFLPDTIHRLAASFCTLLDALVSEPTRPVGLLPILSAADEAQLATWNDTRVAYPSLSLAELFEQQVSRTPEAIALICGDESIRYGELNRRANQLARLLRTRGVGPDVPVGLCMQRSIAAVVGLIGILKAGGACLPLDPAYPAERLAYMTNDAQPLLLLTEVALADRTGYAASRCVLLDRDWPAGEPSHNLSQATRPASLAYIIYTSGSTGQPKGTAITHGSAAAFVAWVRRNFADAVLERVLASTSLCFDLSVFELFAPLCSGGAAVLVRDILDVLAEPARYPVTLINTVPSAMAVLDRADAVPATVKVVNLAGEALPNSLAQSLYRRPGVRQVFNLYGPTEDTTYSTFALIRRGDEGASPIGRPIDNTQAHLLDAYLNPVPVGVAGLLFLGGDGLARGYWGRPGLTAERFIPNPYGAPGSRLYATGDLVRARADGTLEYLGRSDSQVKLRGFRIELGEVETALGALPAVRDAAVLVRADQGGEQAMVAYVVTRDEAAGNAGDEVRQWAETFDAIYAGGAAGSRADRNVDIAPNDVQFDFNVAGWNNSYDGAPLPSAEMREWVDATVARIAALAPDRILEIGCGTGLLLHRLAPGCERYVGTDISGNAIDLVRSAVSVNPPGACRVELHRAAADAIPAEAGADFDTVVINSVAQYFPGVEYLSNVIEQAVGHCRDGGHIFIGDVRHLGLLRAFQTSIELFHASDDTAVPRLAREVVQSVERETELLVDPAWFFALAARLPQIAHVAVLPKPGRADNELTRYRYDVVLSIGAALAPASLAPLAWRPWTEVRDALYALPDDGLLAVRDIPDARVAADVLAARLLEEGRLLDAAQVRAACASAGSQQSVSREGLHDAAAAHGIGVVTAAGGGTEGCFHAVLFRRDAAHAGLDGLDAKRIDWSTLYGDGAQAFAAGSQRYTNRPSAQQHRFRLRNELRRQLQRRLPDFLVPSHIVVLDEMPRTPNGKLDRKALPLPDHVGSGAVRAAPRNPVEASLVAVWSEILALEQVGIHDNFFELGGHSLIATRLIARLNDAMGVRVPVRVLFEAPTVAELAARIDARGLEGRETVAPPIVPAPREPYMPASFAQQRLWVLDRLNPGNPFYNMPIALRLTGTLDVDVLATTVTELVRRHEVLRTALPAVGGVPMQAISPASAVVPVLLDLGDLTPAERERRVAQEAEAESLAPFDLTAGPLYRMRLLRLSAREHVLLFTLHHIVADGWSMAVLVQEVGALYAAFRDGRPSPLPELAIQYADYSAWQRGWLTGNLLEKQLDYWLTQLKDMPPLLTLPTDRPRPPVQRFHGAVQPFSVPAATTAALRAIGARHRATMFMILVAAYDVLLARYAGQTDICIGTAVANRNQREAEKLIGFFVNTLVLRLRVEPGVAFSRLLDDARGVALDAFSNQDVPFEQVVSALNPERDLSHAPLVQATLVLQNAPRSDLVFDDLTIAPLATGQSTSRYDLSLNMSEEGDRLEGRFEYNTDLFDAATVASLAGVFSALLESIAANPEQRVDALGALSAGTRLGASAASTEATATATAMATRADLRAGPVLLHRIIEARVASDPDATALRSDAATLSYGELNARANHLAHYLRTRGIGADAIVALHLDRSVDLVVAMLGVLKAGAAFLPLDPAYPAERRAYILDDARCACVITHSALDSLSGQIPEWCIDEMWPLIATHSDLNVAADVAPANLAYVIYTSGSTGRPKGVGATHAGACNVAELAGPGSVLEVRAGQCVLQFASLSFDAAIWEFVCSLTTGAMLQLASRDALLPGLTLEATLRRYAVNVVLLPPVALSAFTPAALPALDLVISAGEALPAAVAKNWTVPGLRFVNAYGPTETTVCATVHRLPAGSDGSPCIGVPIANVGVAVVDGRGEPALPGAVGELLIFGQGVARGYLGRPALTAERFVPNPFGPPGSRLYATGDLVRQFPDRTLHYVGRADDQVKLRGFRIELSEVETALASCPGVRYAVASLNLGASGLAQLVGYIVEDRSTAPSDRWSGIFEQMYKEGDAPAEHDFDILGWVSSYDNSAIPAADMREWVDQTVGRIHALKPRHVLEIGCGTGLLTHRVAPFALDYLATDLSAEALVRLDGTLRAAGIDNVALQQCTAAELDRLPGRFDTVVANSVLQYFPTEAYLQSMLDTVIERVDDGGHIFLGDVRHLGLAQPFHTSLELFGAPLGTTVGALAGAVAERARNETEMLIDPAFFFALCDRHPRVRSASVRIKAGDADNELTVYRYDVVLEIGASSGEAIDAPGVRWQPWAGLGALEAALADPAGSGASVAVRDIPDGRIALPAFIAARLGEGDSADERDDDATLADWQADFVVQPLVSANIRDLLQLAGRYGAVLELAPSSGAAGLLHAAFRRGGDRIDWAACYDVPANRMLVNQPASAKPSALTRVEVLRHVRRHVPEYMVPSQIVVLDALPLTPNGKIDRAALPDPEPLQPARAVTTGRTPLESALTEIWSELLELDRIELDDDFFELGGHSLLAVQLIATIGERFDVELSLSQLFQTPTVASLAGELSTRQPRRQIVEKLNGGQTGAPLFLLHASDGDAACYAALAKAMSAAQPVYGVSTPQVAGVTGGDAPVEFDALCAIYADAIGRTAPQGPLCVAGWSLGGSFAFAVAALLEQRGREVRWVGLFDTPLLAAQDEARPGIGLAEVVAWLTGMPADEIALRYGPDIESLRQRVALAVQRERIEVFVERLLNDPARVESELDFPLALQRELLAYHAAMNFGLRMTEQFTPVPIAAPVHLFWSEETLQRGADDHAWRAYTGGAARSSSTVLPARHFDFVLGRNAAPLAACLDRLAQAGQSAEREVEPSSEPQTAGEAR